MQKTQTVSASSIPFLLITLLLTACTPEMMMGEHTPAECSDGIDNDRDGAIDCDDIGCAAHSFCAGMSPVDAGPISRGCGPDNCSGCCSGDVCLAGNAANACGAAGRTCIDCGPVGLCSSGTCRTDPASRWNVIIEWLRVPMHDTNGDAWDAFGGLPDPFVRVYVGSESNFVGATSAASDTLEATFNARVATNQRADALRTYLSFEVMDEDVSSHDFIGHCYVPVDDSAFAGSSLTHDCPRIPSEGQAGFTIRWRLERH